MGLTGNDLVIGQVTNSRLQLKFEAGERDKHLYICGATGKGKSKFMEGLIRQDMLKWHENRCGLILLDPHGTMYHSLMRWAALLGMGDYLPIVPIDYTSRERCVAYNPLKFQPEVNPSPIADGIAETIAHVFGVKDLQDTPRLGNILPAFLRALYELGLTLPDMKYVLEGDMEAFRSAMFEAVRFHGSKSVLRTLSKLQPSDFEDYLESVKNRLSVFTKNEAVEVPLGQTGASFSMVEAMSQGQIVLVNLSQQGGEISEADSKLLGTMLLSDLWNAAKILGKRSADKVRSFYVYIDEAQRFVSPTIAENLAQARGFGLHMTLANQFPAQFLDGGEGTGTALLRELMSNASNKVAFGLKDEESLVQMAKQLFLGVFDTEKIKHELHSTKVLDHETRYMNSISMTRGVATALGNSQGEGEASGMSQMFYDGTEANAYNVTGGDSSFSGRSRTEAVSESATEGGSETLVPVLGKELSGIQYQSLDEQLMQAMQALRDLKQRQGVVLTDSMKHPYLFITPDVDDVVVGDLNVERMLDTLQERWGFMFSYDEARANFEAAKRHIEGGDFADNLLRGRQATPLEADAAEGATPLPDRKTYDEPEEPFA